MKKFLLPLLLLPLLFACSNKQKVKELKLASNEFMTQDMKEEIKAAKLGVKSRTLITYFYDKYGKKAEKGDKVEEIFYDESGNKAVQIRYASGGLVDLQYEWHYDDDGNMRYSKTTDMYGTELFYRESEYNAEGDEINREERDKKSREEIETIYTFGDNGKLIEELRRHKMGSVVSRKVFKYDSTKIVAIENYDLNGIKRGQRVYQYDSLGYVSKEILSEGPNFSNTTNYTFDKNGNILEIDEGYFRRTFEYDDNGNVIVETAYNQDGYLQQKLIFAYNSKGLIESRIKTDGEESPVIFTEYQYEFF